MKKINQLLKNKQIIKCCNLGVMVIFAICVFLYTTPMVFADTNDPLAVINNLSNFIAKIIRTLGFIYLMFGVFQIGSSIKSNDPSQRTNGFLSFVGGLIIAFSPDILNNVLLK